MELVSSVDTLPRMTIPGWREVIGALNCMSRYVDSNAHHFIINAHLVGGVLMFGVYKVMDAPILGLCFRS